MITILRYDWDEMTIREDGITYKLPLATEWMVPFICGEGYELDPVKTEKYLLNVWNKFKEDNYIDELEVL